MKLKHYIPVVVTVFVACGGGEPSDTPQGSSPPTTSQPVAVTPPSGPMTMPDWFVVDNTARTVRITLTAGSTPDNNHWNYNGAVRGDLAITVPEGYTVSIEQANRDPNMAHSIGILAEVTSFAMPPQPNPIFPGAISRNPTSMLEATMPGETETIEFVAAPAGNYTLVCFIPGHSAVGMWLFFIVSADGQVGVQAR